MSSELDSLLELLAREPDKLEEALAGFRRIRDETPLEPGSHYNLAAALHGLCRSPEALQILNEAIRNHPDAALLHYGKGCVLQADGRADDALDAFATAVDLDSGHANAWYGLGLIFHGYGEVQRALDCFKRVLSLEVNHRGARHMCDALAQRASPRAPGDFVRELFDSYAGHYEDHLLGSLDYRAPELVGEALARLLPARQSLRVVDLGCGTGLSGSRLREFAETLVGVDVSLGMLTQAEARDCYDQLLQQDIVDYLAEAPVRSVDVLAAVDVFSYLGDLDPVIGLASRVLKPGGMLAFTVEAGEGHDVTLTPAGRYRHSPGYLDSLRSAHYLTQLVADRQVIRSESGAPCWAAVIVWG